MEGLHGLADPMIVSLEAFEKEGAEYDAAHPDAFEQRLASRRPDDVAVLVYTSGTTGKPKGALITHLNLCWVMEHFPPEMPQTPDDDKMAFLPLCHIAERMFGQFLSLQYGARLNYVENPETVAENVREIAPTVMLAVPRIWEKFYSGISIRMKVGREIRRRAFATVAGDTCASACALAWLAAQRATWNRTQESVSMLPSRQECNTMKAGWAMLSWDSTSGNSDSETMSYATSPRPLRTTCNGFRNEMHNCSVSTSRHFR